MKEPRGGRPDPSQQLDVDGNPDVALRADIFATTESGCHRAVARNKI